MVVSLWPTFLAHPAWAVIVQAHYKCFCTYPLEAHSLTYLLTYSFTADELH